LPTIPRRGAVSTPRSTPRFPGPRRSGPTDHLRVVGILLLLLKDVDLERAGEQVAGTGR